MDVRTAVADLKSNELVEESAAFSIKYFAHMEQILLKSRSAVQCWKKFQQHVSTFPALTDLSNSTSIQSMFLYLKVLSLSINQIFQRNSASLDFSPYLEKK